MTSKLLRILLVLHRTAQLPRRVDGVQSIQQNQMAEMISCFTARIGTRPVPAAGPTDQRNFLVRTICNPAKDGLDRVCSFFCRPQRSTAVGRLIHFSEPSRTAPATNVHNEHAEALASEI